MNTASPGLTVASKKLDLIVVIGNDSSYGAEHMKFQRKDRDPGRNSVRPAGFRASRGGPWRGRRHRQVGKELGARRPLCLRDRDKTFPGTFLL
jgi:hypothetical protein